MAEKNSSKAKTSTKKQSVKKQPVLKVENVTASYGAGNVVEDVSFTVNKGETFGMMGLNGVGKTTLIKIFLGLMEAVDGSVEILGKALLDPESKQNLSYLPERFEPPAFLSGMEFIRFALELYGREFDENRTLKAADRLALDRAALYRRVNTYSKGMRQKIGLMSTLLTDCPLLILPMSGLDPKASAHVKEEILAYRKKGKTVFLSSHILADMEEICDRVVVIHGGQMMFEGTPQKLLKDTKQKHLERAFLHTIGEKALAA